ncbi:hypothetical protein CH254_04725 [Rhodococcus sp. 06-412-2C]|uniref:hypothetical protein n=1 Tax=unclassified Rhodococcus (in: high G+C Gram-positive bacteria) TaxID=192944 RepID=UPI000B9A49CE|nr:MULTISPECIES: hypothetical protein [unclassified Rhodococcus (in: high G+C Gram-positive bacteria)]OZC91785.1 hypothetical protein CH254_04725 [Rhodococcus sp. 06-412-2C]OZC92353.1 hypothetical protein CH279_26000 [Rhodococcus sp. 06-412-2B]
MALRPLAAHLAAEIAAHDWSDAHARLDRAGHRRDTDTKAGSKVLTDEEVGFVRTNVMWVTAQVLGYLDSTFDVHEYAQACGVPENIRLSRGRPSGAIDAGLRTIRVNDGEPGDGQNRYDVPGGALSPTVRAVTNSPDAAQCGEVRMRENNAAVADFVRLLAPRTKVIMEFGGTAWGEGYVRDLVTRGPWRVVVWETFRTLDKPYTITDRNGRDYLEVRLW